MAEKQRKLAIDFEDLRAAFEFDFDESWFRFQGERLDARIREWLADHHIEAVDRKKE
jgi:hypothetical protein